MGRVICTTRSSEEPAARRMAARHSQSAFRVCSVPRCRRARRRRCRCRLRCRRRRPARPPTRGTGKGAGEPARRAGLKGFPDHARRRSNDERAGLAEQIRAASNPTMQSSDIRRRSPWRPSANARAMHLYWRDARRPGVEDAREAGVRLRVAAGRAGRAWRCAPGAPVHGGVLSALVDMAVGRRALHPARMSAAGGVGQSTLDPQRRASSPRGWRRRRGGPHPPPWPHHRLREAAISDHDGTSGRSRSRDPYDPGAQIISCPVPSPERRASRCPPRSSSPRRCPRTSWTGAPWSRKDSRSPWWSEAWRATRAHRDAGILRRLPRAAT